MRTDQYQAFETDTFGNEVLYQINPRQRYHGIFPPKGWTSSIDAYQHEAHKHSMCLELNRTLGRSPYNWFLTLCFERPQSADAIRRTWRAACRKLRARKVVAHWIREITRKNTIHYPLIIWSNVQREYLTQSFVGSLPDRCTNPWHMNIQPIGDNDFCLLRYVTKARFSTGTNLDSFSAKRLLFRPSLGLRKFGTIGKFWILPKRQLWTLIKNREQKISEGSTPEIQRLAATVHERLFKNGSLTLDTLKRRLAYFHDAEFVQDWLTQLFPESKV